MAFVDHRENHDGAGMNDQFAFDRGVFGATRKVDGVDVEAFAFVDQR